MTGRFAALSLLFPAILHAHNGSPDVLLDALAGPYSLSIFVKAPRTIPGVADVEIRLVSKDVRAIRLVATLVAGSGNPITPSPEAMQQSKEDPKLFTGSLWLMAPGSWKVRVLADGDRGQGELFVPVPAVSIRNLTMGYALGALLVLFALALVIGAAGIAGASIREGQLWPGLTPSRATTVNARLYMVFTTAIAGGLLLGGNYWWNIEAGGYNRQVHKPLAFSLDIDPEGKLFASTSNAGWLQQANDLLADHGYFMHLYVVSVPSKDKIVHLNPDMQVAGVFTAKLPAMDAGKYRLFGDIVRSNGVPETVMAELELKEPLRGQPLEGDDSQASALPLGRNPDPSFSVLSDKYRMVMVRGNSPIKALVASHFSFRVESKSGRLVEDLELFMGMPAHAAVIKSDRSVFAHVHPMGTAPMASLAMVSSLAAQPSAGSATHSMNMGIPAEISLPYAFPSSGEYRIFVWVKRAGKIETGTFDVNVID